MLEPVVYFSLMARSGAPTREFKAGEVIFQEGDQAREFFIILAGRVHIQLRGRNLETLDRNAIFGEMALIDETPRGATAVAATDVSLVPVSEAEFWALLQHAPHFALCLMRVLSRRLRASNRAHG